MTKEEQERLDYQIKVMQAYKEGAEIEYMKECLIEESWVTTSEPAWNWSACDYRIKPKPKYRPYNAKEFIFDYNKYKLLYYPICKTYIIPGSVSEDGIDCVLNGSLEYYDWEFIKDYMIWQDGTPCGIKE